MKVHCERCDEHYEIADIPALAGRLVKVRCRGCQNVLSIWPEVKQALPPQPLPLPPPPAGPAATSERPRHLPLLEAPEGPAGPLVIAGAGTAALPRVEGSALIEIRQLAARTLATHAQPREPSARFAIEALLGSSRLAVTTPMPEPRAAAPAVATGWKALLAASVVAILAGTVTFGALLYRYVDEARRASHPSSPAWTALAPPAAATALPATAPATTPQPTTPQTASTTPAAPAPAPATVSAAAPEAADPPAIAVRQRHRETTARPKKSKPRLARSASTAAGHGHARAAASLDDDDLTRILESTRMAGSRSR